jgi:hypothetical protein
MKSKHYDYAKLNVSTTSDLNEEISSSKSKAINGLNQSNLKTISKGMKGYNQPTEHSTFAKAFLSLPSMGVGCFYH